MNKRGKRLLSIMTMAFLLVSSFGCAFARQSEDVRQINLAKTALINAGTLNPVEGVNANIKPMAQAIVNAAATGVIVSVYSSSNSQVAKDGTITYGTKDVSGTVTFTLVKSRAKGTQGVNVVVPAMEVVEPPVDPPIDPPVPPPEPPPVPTNDVTCSALGMVKNDAAASSNNATLLYQAIKDGKLISVDGVYYLGLAPSLLANTTLSLTGVTSDAEFKLKSSGCAFRIDNDVDINVSKVKFSPASNDDGDLFYFEPDCLSNKVVIDSCAFNGSIQIMYFRGSTTINPALGSFGIKELTFTNNVVNNTRTESLNLIDMPSDMVTIEGNTIHNFDYVWLNHGIMNGITYEAEMFYAQKKMIVRNNNVSCDWWANTDNQGYYLCFVLFEGIDCTYEGNTVEGLKFYSGSDEGACVYDSYLSCQNLVYTGNTLKNNLSFNTNKQYNDLIKSKEGPKNSTTLYRHYENNHYVVEESYIRACATELGKDPSLFLANGYVQMIDLHQPSATFEIINNTFDVYDLYRTDMEAYIENYKIIGNTFNLVKAEGWSMSEPFYLFRGDCGNLFIQNNTINAPLGYFLYGADVNNATITGNTIQSSKYQDVSAYWSSIVNLVFGNNTFF